MLASVRAGFARTAAWTGLASPAPEVEQAMRRVPRERFVPARLRNRAFEDQALGIGHGATISQPFIVSLMTTLARLAKHDGAARVLEIGTGSGYQAAILSQLAGQVHTLEIVPELRQRSAAVLAELGCDNVEVLEGDGWSGLPYRAPFDAILVTACASAVPEALRDELAPGGRMVLPIQAGQGEQQLVLVEKDQEGATQERIVLPVRFVPMVGRGC